MKMLKHPTKNLLKQFRHELRDSRLAADCLASAEHERFKLQLKRAVDSVTAPQYLIDAIKASIRS